MGSGMGSEQIVVSSSRGHHHSPPHHHLTHTWAYIPDLSRIVNCVLMAVVLLFRRERKREDEEPLASPSSANEELKTWNIWAGIKTGNWVEERIKEKRRRRRRGTP